MAGGRAALNAPFPSTARHAPVVFLVVGALSGLLCWLGGLLAPDQAALMRIFPGIVFGYALYAAGRQAGYAARRPAAATCALVVLIAVVAWRVAIDIGYLHGHPWPMLVAGALGGLVLAVGLSFAWHWRRHLLATALLVTAVGGLTAQGVQWLWNAWPGMDERLKVSVLFVVWQALVMVTIALAAPPADGA